MGREDRRRGDDEADEAGSPEGTAKRTAEKRARVGADGGDAKTEWRVRVASVAAGPYAASGAGGQVDKRVVVRGCEPRC